MQNIVARFKQLDSLDENVIPIPKQAMKVSIRRGLGLWEGHKHLAAQPLRSHITKHKDVPSIRSWSI